MRSYIATFGQHASIKHSRHNQLVVELTCCWLSVAIDDADLVEPIDKAVGLAMPRRTREVPRMPVKDMMTSSGGITKKKQNLWTKRGGETLGAGENWGFGKCLARRHDVGRG